MNIFLLQLSFLTVLSHLALSSTILKESVSKNAKNRSKSISWPIRTHRSRVKKEIPLMNKNDVEYLVKVKLGTGAQEYNLLMDTASSDLWVPYFICNGCKQTKKYHCGLSRTCYVDEANRVKLNYSGGRAEGFLAYDQLRMEPNIFIPQQSFTVVDYIAGEITDIDGIVGLHPSSGSMNHNPSFLESLFNLGHINSLSYSIFLNTQRGKEVSRLILGDFDRKYMKDNSSLVWVNMSQAIAYKEIKVGSLSIPLKNKTLLINSGQSCVTLPENEIFAVRNAFWKLYGIACHFYIEEHAPDFSMMNCFFGRNSKEFPTVTIGLNEGEFPLQPKDYIYECALMKNKTLKCFTKFELSQTQKHAVLGMAFFNVYYFVFNFTEKKFGVAPSIAENQFEVFNFVGESVGQANSTHKMLELLKGDLTESKRKTSSEAIVMQEDVNYDSVSLTLYIIATSVIMIFIILLVVVLYCILSKRKVYC